VLVPGIEESAVGDEETGDGSTGMTRFGEITVAREPR
jgi:hypothetical protein